MTRKPLNALMAGLMALGLSQTAFAANSVPFPQLADPTVACQKLVGAGPAATFNLCMEPEQQGYNIAKAAWDQLSQQSAEFCAAQSHNVMPHGQYAALGYCVIIYLQADELKNAMPRTFQW